jgi:hypothetical protein
MAKSDFESLMEEIVPEINFLTASGAGVKPGSVLESLDKDIIVGFLPEFIKDVPSLKDKTFDTKEEAYDLKMRNTKGSVSRQAAIQFMNLVGLKYNNNLNYQIDFDIAEMTSVKFADDLEKINFEIALSEYKKQDRNSKKIFKRFKNHILVLRVIYAKKYEVKVSIEKDGQFEADVDVKEVDVSGNAGFEKKDNTLIVSNNEEVPFGVIGFKIKGNKLKEIN